MYYQYIGVQMVSITQGGEVTRLRIEMDEHNRRTRLFINDILVDKVFLSPSDAYSEAAKLAKKGCIDIKLAIDVASNMMDSADIEQIFLAEGFNVQNVTDT